jgi:flagellum-specific peptidoglycan hydrolase FlgJ
MSDGQNPQDNNSTTSGIPEKDQAHIIEQAVDPHQYHQELEKHAKSEVNSQTQRDINTPLADDGSKLSAEDEAFLKDIVEKVDNKQINPLTPSTILNQAIYDELSGEEQAKTDLFVQSSLFVIRKIYDYYKSEHTNDSYMMQNMIHELRVKKETLEQEIGDVLKI